MISKNDWQAIRQALYGGAHGWIAKLAADLGVVHRTLKKHVNLQARRFTNAEAVESRIGALIRKRRDQLNALAKRFPPPKDEP